MRALCAELGSPEHAYRCTVVAGTNGKGSSAAALADALRRSGRRVGLFTSPHLLRFSERFRVDGAELDAQTLLEIYRRVKTADARCQRPASFFELGTAMALLAFADAGVDDAVLEVGLGGRLDATNVVPRALSMITAVGMDHQVYLGDTLEAIAGEKAGIIEPEVPVVMAPQAPAAERVIRARALELGAELHSVDFTAADDESRAPH
ncbi:MAG: bifunctional folylpolyglutamate synthase/dihydrofolate synthase, partial [Myxococcota bacterium]